MNQPLQNCPHCGANLSLDDLRHTDCPYCHTALPHHAQAAGHAALVNQMLADKGVGYQVPYQYGAAPPPQIADQVQRSVDTANKAIATSVIVSVVIALAVAFLVVAVAVVILFVGVF